MINLLSKIFGGTKSQKDINKILPIVNKCNEYYKQFTLLTNNELRNKTLEFKAIIKEYLEKTDQEIAQLSKTVELQQDNDIFKSESIYKQIDQLQIRRTQEVEDILNKILPEAFAVVKETARRFKENKVLESKATDLDIVLSEKKEYIQMEGEKAYYKNSWIVGGSEVTWNMIHYDVQLIGGITLHEGKISEMGTGEGKTLVSTLPAYLNALAGEGVHIVTVNDYLAKRDSEWNAPLFEWLSLTVDCIDKYSPNSVERRKAYRADITYGTNNEFGFDYLRDNMVYSSKELVQRKHHCAIIDEVDSILIDDARTPLIISGRVSKDNTQKQYQDLVPKISRMYEKQKLLISEYLQESKKNFSAKKLSPKEGGLPLFRAFKGLPKYNPLIKFLSEKGVKVELQRIENFYLSDNQKEMPLALQELYFSIDEKNNVVELTEKGLNYISQGESDSNFFVLPELSTELEKIEISDILQKKEKIELKEKLANDYAIKSDRIHAVLQLLKAYSLFQKDIEYVVVDGEVKIVDEQTGRIMEGRRYSDGLHQAIEAKEKVKIEGASQTYATITLQNYFRMYHKLSGMTGTAVTEATEFWQIYKLDVVTIPTNLPCVRSDYDDLVYKTKREKYKAVIEEIKNLREKGRPVLVGTTSVEVSELVSRMLKQEKIPHNVLNAKQHEREAFVVAEAGNTGIVTIATNMAGRGTDIKLGAGVKDAGGLSIIGTERHDSRRVDRQLRGRAGRQGDPGSSQFFVSLEDNLMRMFGSQRIASLMDKMGYKEGEVIQHGLVTKSIERAQKKIEENNFGIRKRLLEYDDVVNKQRNAIYTKRNHALFGNRISIDIDNSFYILAQKVVSENYDKDKLESLKLQSLIYFGIEPLFTPEDLVKKNQDELINNLYFLAIQNYKQRCEDHVKTIEPLLQEYSKLLKDDEDKRLTLPFTNKQKIIVIPTFIKQTLASKGQNFIKSLEQGITLSIIDEHWKEHLRLMDELKQSVQSAVYEQKDPLVIYKMEAFSLFSNLDYEINKNIVSFLSHCFLLSTSQASKEAVAHRAFNIKDMNVIKRDISQAVRNQNPQSSTTSDNEESSKPQPIVKENKIGRNDSCPCGSGKKYKNCHMKIEVE